MLTSKMTDCSETVVFRKDDTRKCAPVSFSDDDSALVKAYDKAIQSFRVQTSEEDSGEVKQDGTADRFLQTHTPHKPASASTTVSKQWAVGAQCRAVWSEDGLIYPATIISLDGERCRVQFEGYGNEEDVDLSALLPAIPQQPWRERQWCLGSPCRAVWSEDGLVYPGVIVWMKGERCRVRFDVYDNEEEVEFSALLPPEETQMEDETDTQEESPGDGSSGGGSSSSSWRRSEGKAKSPEKPRHGHATRGDEEGKRSRQRGVPGTFPPFPFIPPVMPPMGTPDLPMFPPPPPPAFTWPPGKAGLMGSDDSEDEIASLSGMLLSWYLCGYHTGYYMGLQQANTGPDMSIKKKKKANGMENLLKTEE